MRMLLQLAARLLAYTTILPTSTIRQGAKSHKLLFFSPILQSLLQTQELFKLNHRLESSIMSSTIWWCCGLQCSSDIPDIPWAPLYFPRPVFIQSPLCPILPKVKMWLKTFQLQHFNERTTLLNPTKWRANPIVVGAVLFQEYQLSSEPRGRHKSTWRPHLITMTQLRGETDSLIWSPASVWLSGHWWGLMRICIGAEWVLTKM